jgi:KUP system potassium uptake protein
VMWRKRSLHEAAHKVSNDEPDQVTDGAAAPPKLPQRKVLHEAAHKVGAYEPHDLKKPAPRVFEADRDVVARAGKAMLALGALGVVYGDLGTSPLYTEQVLFTEHRSAVHATPAGVYGIVSLIFWSLVIVVCIKYAGVIMRAHNRGDGGILALTALMKRCKVVHVTLFITLGIFGASLFLGDGMVTPAISVLSAVGA